MINDGKGILQQIRENEHTTELYPRLTEKHLTDTINNMKLSKRPNQKDYIVYTGHIGAILFNLALLGLSMNIPRWSLFTLGKNSKYKNGINIGDIEYTFKSGKTKTYTNHHSNIKVYVNVKQCCFDIYKGTFYMMSVKELDTEFINKIKQLI